MHATCLKFSDWPAAAQQHSVLTSTIHNLLPQGLRLVFRHEADMLGRMGVSVVCVVCSFVAVAAVACLFMARALRRAGAREAALEADLMRQKEALQQAERKSMNKSNAFARASHDIRSSLAAVAGLIDVARPEARANSNLTYCLNQMDVGTKKLFGQTPKSSSMHPSMAQETAGASMHP